MQKTDKEQEFIEIFKTALEELRKLSNLTDLTLSADAAFGAIVRQFSRGNIIYQLAMLAAAEIQIVEFSQEQINNKLKEVLKATEPEYTETSNPSSKKDLN